VPRRGIDVFFLGGQQIKQERGEVGLLQRFRDVLLRGLCLLLPCANRTMPRALSGMCRSPSSSAASAAKRTSRALALVAMALV
jgi:hypothetical protein